MLLGESQNSAIQLGKGEQLVIMYQKGTLPICDKATQGLDHGNHFSPQTPDHIFGLLVEAAAEY